MLPRNSHLGIIFTPWLRFVACYSTHVAHLPHPIGWWISFCPTPTQAAHLRNRRMARCDSLSGHYSQPWALPPNTCCPTPQQVQPSVEMDVPVKSWSVSSLCGCQLQVGQSHYFLILKQIGLWLFYMTLLNPDKVDYRYMVCYSESTETCAFLVYSEVNLK